MAEVPGTSSRQRWTLVLVCTAAFMLLLDITVVTVALPSIQRDLRASLPDLQWVSAALCPGAGRAAAAGGHPGRPAGPAPAVQIPATGRSITLNLCDVHEIRDGKIRMVQSYFDSASMLMQLGVMPEAAVGAKA